MPYIFWNSAAAESIQSSALVVDQTTSPSFFASATIASHSAEVPWARAVSSLTFVGPAAGAGAQADTTIPTMSVQAAHRASDRCQLHIRPPNPGRNAGPHRPGTFARLRDLAGGGSRTDGRCR